MNDHFEILGVFTGEITFETGVKVETDIFVTPNTDVPLIFGTQIMEENKMSIDFHSKQIMMEKESNAVDLNLAYKPEIPRHVHLCEMKENNNNTEMSQQNMKQFQKHL